MLMSRSQIMRALAIALGLTMSLGTAALAADAPIADGELGGDVLSNGDGALNEPRDFGAVCPGTVTSASAGFNTALGITQVANSSTTTASTIRGSYVEGGVTGAGVTFSVGTGAQGWTGAQIPTFPPLTTPTPTVPVSQMPKDGSLSAAIVGTATLVPPTTWNTNRLAGKVWPDGSPGAPAPIHGLVVLTVGADATPNDATDDDGTDGAWNGTALWKATGVKWQDNTKTTSTTIIDDRPMAVRWSVLDGDSASCDHAPAIVSARLADGACGQPSSLAVTLSDDDLAITSADHEHLAVTVDWNDGTAPSSSDGTGTSRTFSHTFAHAGSHAASITVTDQHDARATTSASAVVPFDTSGILQPINANGSSIFKSVSTIPVKVRFMDCDGSVPFDLAPTIGVVKTSSSTPVSGVSEAARSTSEHTDGVMRFSDGQWIYNLSGKSLSDPSATYRLTINVPGTGQTVVVDFALKT
jgi:hypothetical protein